VKILLITVLLASALFATTYDCKIYDLRSRDKNQTAYQDNVHIFVEESNNTLVLKTLNMNEILMRDMAMQGKYNSNVIRVYSNKSITAAIYDDYVSGIRAVVDSSITMDVVDCKRID